MAQAPQKPATPPPTAPQQRSAIPPAPQQQPAARQQVNIHGMVAPQPNMAPDEPEPEGLSDNTRAEMAAGRKNLGQHSRRNNAEHEAGRRANRQRSGAAEPDPETEPETNP